jgi:cytochrome c peroxidase
MMNDPSFDHGSVAPRVLRYSFHATGHWDPDGTPVGGSNGGSIRLEPERSYDDNLGFGHVEAELLAIASDFPECSAADVFVLAGYLAIQQLGGPTIPFCPGRVDFPEGSGAASCPMAGRLPHVSSTPAQLRETFGRMGCDDRCIVALIGAHSVGSTHPEISGFPNTPWNDNPLEFDNKVSDSTTMSMCRSSLRKRATFLQWKQQQDTGAVPTPHAFRYAARPQTTS